MHPLFVSESLVKATKFSLPRGSRNLAASADAAPNAAAFTAAFMLQKTPSPPLRSHSRVNYIYFSMTYV
jgi:hypothetical protein